MRFIISEKFVTISGEAPVPGTPFYLIRFSGCNLQCPYCDTTSINQASFTLSRNELYEDIQLHLTDYPYLKVLFTGGEPLLGERQHVLYEIIKRFNGKTHFYIETNGSIHIDFYPRYTHFICDWKTPSSGEDKKFDIENIKTLRPESDCLKFVLIKDDFQWVIEKMNIIKKVNPRLPVYLSPQWEKLPYKDLAEFILMNKLPGIMSTQFHKIIWKNEKEGIRDGTIV